MKKIFVEFIVSIIILLSDVSCMIFMKDITLVSGFVIGLFAILGIIMIVDVFDRIDIES